MNLDAYRITSEPFYQPVGDEIAVFEAAFTEREGTDRVRQDPICRAHGMASGQATRDRRRA